MDLSSARTLFPLITESGLRTLMRIREHACAPQWTCDVGDHVTAEDLAAVDVFRSKMHAGTSAPWNGPPEAILAWIHDASEHVPLFRERIPIGFDLAKDWGYVPTMQREDLASRIEWIVPTNAPLERLIAYETSGTTGHAVRVPHHPRAVAALHALLERALEWHGHSVRAGPDGVACMNVHAQANAWVYPSVFSVWQEAGFARVNLNERFWPGGRTHAARFLGELAPGFIAGDPTSFAELLRWEIDVRPSILLSTAVALSAALEKELSLRYGCRVINWYSTTETGPIACSKPGGEGLALLAPDLYVEVVDAAGMPAAEGERGEVTVTGGRNPYVPLLRYRTGDFARRVSRIDARGEREVRLVDLEGRAAVLFRAGDGSPVNPVDIGRVLRDRFAVVQHTFVQRADGSCRATLRPAFGLAMDAERVEGELKELFGASTRVEVIIDASLGLERKVVPYRSELHP